MSIENKRIAILSLISDDNTLWNEISNIVKDRSTGYKRLQKIYFLLREYVKIAEVEKKKFGEVMTPLDLVKEMLSTLPKEVWSNPNLKWLDPANGTGPFPIIVIYKLMKGLEIWEPNEELRYKHIIENMIYVCEIQPKNMFLYLCAIDPKDEYDCNIYTGSFLEEGFDRHMKEVWNVDKFDIIIGNPPYQDLVGKSNTEPIWDKFVKNSFTILNDNGFLNMVHPSGWRSPEGRFRYIYDLFLEKQILYLSLNDFNAGLRVFGVGTNFDYYCIRNTKNNDEILTKIKDQDDEIIIINLNSITFIPGGMFDTYINLITKENNKVEILHDYTYEHRKKCLSKEKNDDFKLPVIYTITKKDGLNLRYSNVNNGHFGIPKVIFSNGLGTYPVIDDNGEYGLTGYAYGIVDNVDNLENIKNALSSEKMIKLMQYSKFTNDKYNHRVLSTFKKDFWKEFI